MKYVVFDGYNGEQIIISPKRIQHSHFAESITKLSYGTMHPISGVFIANGECVGESESLRMESRGDRDTALIKEMLCLDDGCDAKPVEAGNVLNSTARNRNKRLRKARK